MCFYFISWDLIDIINLNFEEMLKAVWGSCLLLAYELHVTPMKIIICHWKKAGWAHKEIIQWMDRGVVDITFLNFWKSGNSLSLEYSSNKKEYQIGVTQLTLQCLLKTPTQITIKIQSCQILLSIYFMPVDI